MMGGNADLDWQLLSNACYGESPNGEWTLKVVDAAATRSGRTAPGRVIDQVFRKISVKSSP